MRAQDLPNIGSCFWAHDQARGRWGRMRLLFNLASKLNQAFLRAQDLDDILYAIMVGVTAGEGLGFNRAFLVRFDKDRQVLSGQYALGPCDSEDASRIWSTINRNGLGLFQILEGVRDHFSDKDHPLNRLARRIQIPFSPDSSSVFVRALREQKSVVYRKDSGFDALGIEDLLAVQEFAVAPLICEEQPFGLIIADNFVTGNPVEEGDLEDLQLFAGFASVAVGKTKMCEDLEKRVRQLQSLNEQLEQKKNMLVQAERHALVGRMADHLFHEIRNPVSSIGGMAKILKKKLNAPDLIPYLDIILDQSERLERTLKAVFDVANEPVLNRERVNLYQLIRSTVGLMKGECDGQGIDLNLDLPSGEIVLSLDGAQFQQAFLNILKNSMEAMPDGGLLMITVVRVNHIIEIRVTDTGMGMPRGHLNRAHEPFFTTKIQAMGLGLSMAKRIFELHGGNLCIQKNRTGGTSVVITLPMDESHGID